MTVVFNQIPINLRVPGHYIEFNNTNIQRGLPGYPAKVLVIGQKTAAGQAPALTPMLITSVDQAKHYFGAGSQLAQMLERLKGVDSFTECWAIAQVDDVAASTAAAEISFTGAAAAAGTLMLYIGGRLTKVGVSQGSTAAQTAAAVVAAVNANTDLAVTAAVDADDAFKVALTAKNKGLVANDIDVRIGYYQDDVVPSGVTFSITPMAGGAGNPDVGAVLSVLGDLWYTDIVMPYTDTNNIVEMETALSERAGPLKMIEAKTYISRAGTVSQMVTIGSTRNHPYVFPLPIYKAPSPTYEWAAAMAIACAGNLRDDPARPMQSVALPGLMPPLKKDLYQFDERNILLYNGHSTFSVDEGGVVRLERVISSYRKNAFGGDDDSYLNIETIATLAYLRYDARGFMAQRYPRHKLADDGNPASQGNHVVTPKILRAALVSRAVLWNEAGLIENLEDFKAKLLLERSTADRDRVDAIVAVDTVNQFRVGAYQLDLQG